MAQTGDPTGHWHGRLQISGLKAEFNTESHQRGVCSMARAQNPNSANSQFFICFDDASFLTANIRCGARLSKAWRMSTKSNAANRVRDPDQMLTVRVMADVQ